MDKILKVKDLHVSFFTDKETVRVLNGFNLEVSSGDIVGLVGESGSGKSVAVQAIINLLRRPGEITEGQVYFDGCNLLDYSEDEMRRLRGKMIGVIPTNPRAMLHPMIPIGKQIASAYQAHSPGITQQSAERKVLEMLEKVQIPDAKYRSLGLASELSGGMAQRVLIAMALINNPKLVIADDATTGLDVTVQAQVLDLIRGMVTEMGSAAIIVTHDLGIVAQYCHQAAILYAGRLVEYSSSVAELFHRAAHPHTQTLLAATPGTPVHFEPQVLPAGSAKRTIPVRGCVVQDRCRRVASVCLAKPPDSYEVSPGHWAECHFPRGVAE